MLELTNLNYIFILIEGFLFRNSFKKKSKVVLTVIGMQLILLLGLRGASVGIDTRTYIDLFWAIKNGWTVDYLEIGNQIIYNVISEFFNSPVALLMSYALITIIPVLKVIKKDSHNIFFSVILYAGFMYYYWAFNAMRQAAAMSIAFWAISCLEENKTLKYFLLVMLAALFHKSALLVLLFGIVKKTGIRANKNWAIWVITLSGVGALFGNKIISLGVMLFRPYEGYIDSAFAENGNALHPILFLLIFLVVLLMGNGLTENEQLLLTMLSVGVVLYFVSIKIGIVNRITYYFTMPLIILLPNWLESLKGQNKRLTKVIFYIGISLYQFLVVLKGTQGIVPYRFFWQ